MANFPPVHSVLYAAPGVAPAARLEAYPVGHSAGAYYAGARSDAYRGIFRAAYLEPFQWVFLEVHSKTYLVAYPDASSAFESYVAMRGMREASYLSLVLPYYNPFRSHTAAEVECRHCKSNEENHDVVIRDEATRDVTWVAEVVVHRCPAQRIGSWD